MFSVRDVFDLETGLYVDSYVDGSISDPEFGHVFIRRGSKGTITVSNGIISTKS